MALEKKFSEFFNRTDLTTNNAFQIVGCDLTNPSDAEQNQRSPITQILRSGRNLSDLVNVSTAVTNLGATSASTANALMRRDANGVVNAAGLNIDGATQPTLNIGATAAFNFGIATGNNQFFSGTVNGDTCIRATNTARQLLFGVGSGNAQFAILNTVVQSNITHRFGYAGTNRMPFLNGTSDLTGNANYTVNGTGALTITGLFTSAGANFTASVNITTTNQALNLGSSQAVTVAKSSGISSFFNGTVANDGVLRVDNTGARLFIGVGATTAQQIISNTQIITNVPVNSVANINVTATDQSYNLGSSQMVTLSKVTTLNSFFNTTVADDGVLRVDNTSARLFIGVGATTAQQIISNTQVGFNVPIKLPTTGGTPAALDYYEQTTFDVQMSAPDGVTYTYNVLVSRIGKVVTLSIPFLNVVATANIFFDSTIPLPVRFRCASGFETYIVQIVNNNLVLSTGVLEVSGGAFGGYIKVLTQGSAPFTASQPATIYATSVSYLTT